MADKSYTDDQLPMAAINPGLFGGPKLTHAQKALLDTFRKLPAQAQRMLKQQAIDGRIDYIPGRDIREAAGMFKTSREDPHDVLMNSMADSMAAEPDALADSTDEGDPFPDTTIAETFVVGRWA
jgi:hypothetical protein